MSYHDRIPEAFQLFARSFFGRVFLWLRQLTCFVIVIILFASSAPAQRIESNFLKKYCIDCHGADTQEADRRFDSLNFEKLSSSDAEAWHEILDRLNLGDMPPEDAEPLPTDKERLDMVARLTKKLASASATGEATQTVLRRLNRREYDASMRFMLGLEHLNVDPTADFTPDQSEHHFDNIGDKLVLSDFLLTRYLEASEQYLSAARELAAQNPESNSWTFKAPFCRNMPNPDGQDRDGQYQHLRENATDKFGYLWLKKLRRGVPASGRYRIRVKAEAINRDHPYRDMILRTAREDSLRLAIVAGDTRAGDLATNNPTDQTLAEFDVPDNKPTWLETTAWLDKYYQPRFAFPNGPAKIKYMRHLLMRYHRDLFPKYLSNHVHVFATMHPDYDKETAPALERAFLDEQDRLKKAGKPYDVFGTAHRMHTDEAWIQFYNEYQGPRIRIHEVKIDGPLIEEEPPRAARFFPQREIAEASAKRLINAFAQRAWRKSGFAIPANNPQDSASADKGREPARLAVQLYSSQRESGMSQLDALQLAYQAILCSPQFLYHRTQHGQLSEIELASRLSFFLWGTPPDRELLELASAGKLSNRQILRQQTERLLNNEKRQNFINAFTDSWLQLKKLGTMLPDRVEHPAYFNERLESAMRTETRMYVDDAIQNNRPVSVFVDSDYTFLNSSLARLYKIKDVRGHEFRKVRLTDRKRGGLLGHASILTASANGIDTSPVVRGMWVMECLLGTPPPPPPPDVEAIEPDIRGTTTIREQLAAHREVATCANCHRRIDPPGFAMEAFDEIGQFRTHYDTGGWKKKQLAKIDPSGQLASGESFRDIAELRSHLVEKVDLVAANFVSRLITQATGRFDDPQDKAEVLALVNLEGNENAGARELIHRVVQSESFRR